jgi:hypothetical protein
LAKICAFLLVLTFCAHNIFTDARRLRDDPVLATLEGPDKECSIHINQTVWFPETSQCETLLAKGKTKTVALAENSFFLTATFLIYQNALLRNQRFILEI